MSTSESHFENDVNNNEAEDQETQIIKEMMRQLPLNVMLVDKDLVLTYMNDTSERTLRGIESQLSVRVDDLIGTCIDVFHKDPAHQRRLLGDPKKHLPYNAEIKIGNEDVSLQADGVFAEDGTFLGCMATWSIITEQKKVELRNLDYKGQIAAIDKSQAVIEFNMDGTIIEANENFLNAVGYSLNEIQGKHHSMFVDSEHSTSVEYRAFWESLNRGEYQSDVYKRFGKGKKEIWIQASYNPIMDIEGNPCKVVKYATDVSEQKELERKAVEAQVRERHEREELQTKVDQLLNLAESASQGDLTGTAPFSGDDPVGQLAAGLDNLIESIRSALTEVNGGTVQIDQGAQQISSASQSLSGAASQQAANLEEISASLEEMSSMTKQNADNCQQAASLSEESQSSADRGTNEMASMNEAMAEITKSSGEISKIIKVIDEIAFQTNLLALNAAVEAARAGEAGKGFAVVAEEVRNLAQRSAEAAKNTSVMIEESSKRAENGAAIASRVGEALGEIVTSTEKVNSLLAEVASASQEQADGVTQINKGVSELDTVTQQNAANSEELAATAEQTAAQVGALSEVVSRFNLGEDTSGGGQTHAVKPASRSGGPVQPSKKLNFSKGKPVGAAAAAIPFDDDSFDSF